MSLKEEVSGILREITTLKTLTPRDVTSKRTATPEQTFWAAHHQHARRKCQRDRMAAGTLSKNLIQESHNRPELPSFSWKD